MKPNKKTTIVIIEDNRLLREGISAVINEQPDLKVIATFSDRDKSLSKIEEIKPVILLIDIGLRNQNSLQIVKSIKKKSPFIKIIVMDLLPVETDILEFVEAGASGFILKDDKVQEFLKTIRLVAEGKEVLPTNMTESLFSQIIERAASGVNKKKIIQAVIMTKRERQVIELIAEGMSNKEIAFNLHLSPYTIKSHVHNILEKMSLHTRVQIAKYAYSNQED